MRWPDDFFRRYGVALEQGNVPLPHLASELDIEKGKDICGEIRAPRFLQVRALGVRYFFPSWLILVPAGMQQLGPSAREASKIETEGRKSPVWG